MKLMIAGLLHETNTFSPVETPLARFCPNGRDLLRGEEAIRRYRGTESCVGGFIEIAEAASAEFELPLAAHAPPSAPVSLEAFETMSAMIIDCLKASHFDGLLLALHGAMVVDGFDDGEGELLRRIRAVRPDVPIAVALDMHANIFPAMVELADVTSGYHLYPHTDMAETARRAGSILLSKMAGKVAPTTAWGSVPMLPHTMRQGTHEWPNRELQALAAAWEADGRALSASVFTGFNLADVSHAGLSALVVTDGDQAAAQAMVEELLDNAWAARGDFRYVPEPLADSIARAKQMTGLDGPIFLLDHYDNSASGGTMDTTAVLAEILRQELQDVAFFGLCDPEAVETAIQAGVGAKIELEVGGRVDLPSLNVPNLPLRIRGTVRTLSDGLVPSRTKASFGMTMSMGKVAVIDTGGVEVVLVSKQIEPFSIDMLTAVGIDPRRRRYVAIKSRHHWRADLGPLAAAIIDCAGLGVCTSDYTQLKFHKLQRPTYPLDAEARRDGRSVAGATA
ncbi:M81 family metallopeptidase [Phenylobacterium sp.]|uniref:M81 family metallopeptidase n=1 Tax=Phenylobacterium sp. TaxID=1871053 RepID=UPI00301B75B5